MVVTQHWRGSMETEVGVAWKAQRRPLWLMDVVWQGISLCFTLARQLVDQRDARTRLSTPLWVSSEIIFTALLHVRPAQNILKFGQGLNKLKNEKWKAKARVCTLGTRLGIIRKKNCHLGSAIVFSCCHIHGSTAVYGLGTRLSVVRKGVSPVLHTGCVRGVLPVRLADKGSTCIGVIPLCPCPQCDHLPSFSTVSLSGSPE